MSETVDLSRFEEMNRAQEEGIPLPLLDEAGSPIGLKLTIVGPDSALARKAMKDVAKEFAARAEARGDMSPADDDGDERMIAYLAKVTTGWAPNPSIGGQAVPFNEKNAVRFFTIFRLFMDQAQVVATRRAPFARSSSTTSAASSQTKPPAAASKSRKRENKSGIGSVNSTANGRETATASTL